MAEVTYLEKVEMMNLDELAAECHRNSSEHGFWEGQDEKSLPEKIALMHAELSEALEHFREGKPLDEIEFDHTKALEGVPKPDGVAVEFADTIIRILDTCGRFGIPIHEAVATKMNYNLHRPHMHGKNC